MLKPTLTALALAALCAGCVTQKTFDALRAEQEETQRQLEARNARLREYEKSTAQLQKAGEDLRAQLATEQEKAKELQAEISRLEAERAAMVKDKSSLQASVADMTNALSELKKRKDEADARIAEFKGLLNKFKSLIDAGKLKVRIVEGRMVVVLATDVLFSSGSANLSKDGKVAIGEVAGLLASIPKRKFQVEGHTDNVPIATAQYPSNWELASARALNVVKTMIDAGMPADRISAASFGDSKPAVANDSNEGRAQNRRIEIIIVPDLSTLPGFDELNRAQSS